MKKRLKIICFVRKINQKMKNIISLVLFLIIKRYSIISKNDSNLAEIEIKKTLHKFENVKHKTKILQQPSIQFTP